MSHQPEKFMKTTLISSLLALVMSSSAAFGGVNRLSCFYDRTPVDGLSQLVQVVTNDAGTQDVTVETSNPWAGGTSKEVIAERLTCTQNGLLMKCARGSEGEEQINSGFTTQIVTRQSVDQDGEIVETQAFEINVYSPRLYARGIVNQTYEIPMPFAPESIFRNNCTAE
jgi:hypothetical protein